LDYLKRSAVEKASMFKRLQNLEGLGKQHKKSPVGKPTGLLNFLQC
jgi:hypothetical protein